MYSDNYNTLKKQKTNKWKDIACSWTGRIIIVKMIILHKANHSINGIAFFNVVEQIMLKFVWTHKKTPKS